jgi:hypothetical protein
MTPMRWFIVFLVGCCIATGALPGSIRAAELITSFDVDVTITEDGRIIVTETIDVMSEGIEIVHGIYRDFFRSRKTRDRRVTTPITILGITRDGDVEPYQVKNMGDIKRVYIGDKKRTVPTGAHTYTLTYQTERVVDFGASFDSITWNVTGNTWALPILSTRVRVNIPSGEISDVVVSTGAVGSTDAAASTQIAASTVVSSAINPFNPGEGMTITIWWPKGIVQPPTGIDALRHAILDYFGLGLAIASFAFCLLYFVLTWHRVGRDPRKQTIVPQYEPPRDTDGNLLEPAVLRYLYKRSTDTRGLVATLLWLARDGQLKITQRNKKTFELEVTKKQSGSPLANAVLLQLRNIKQPVTMGKKEVPEITATLQQLSNLVRQTYGEQYFKHNALWIGLGLFITGSGAAASIGASLIILGTITWQHIVVLGLTALTGIIGGLLTRAYTAYGRAQLDHVLGFRWFLSVTEKDRLAFEHPPEKTPELYATYLPYAIALGVEQRWSEQFHDVLARATTTKTYGGLDIGSLIVLNSLISTGHHASTPQSNGGIGAGSGAGGAGGGGW